MNVQFQNVAGEHRPFGWAKKMRRSSAALVLAPVSECGSPTSGEAPPDADGRTRVCPRRRCRPSEGRGSVFRVVVPPVVL